ncbi:MAG: DUF1080 domain-containing protein [Verrucomicrobiota bacterium]
MITTVGSALLLAATVSSASTGSPFYGDPPDERHAWAVHDHNRPQPPRVEPLPASSLDTKAPAGAVILCDGTEASLANWEADKNGNEPTKWIIHDGAMECVPKSGYVRTKQKFGDCQLHVEWAAPTPPQGESQGRGNSGIFLMGAVEIQVLDNYNNPTYADGFACSMYGVNPPKANALRPPGEFQCIDIEFRRPVYKDGQCVEPGYVTVKCNGILVQDHTQIEGGTGHRGRSKPGPLPEVGPLKLQDHGNPVRFRNIWIRELPPRSGAITTYGPLSASEVAAQRKETAATLRKDAATLTEPVAKATRLMESLVYENDAATLKQVEQMFGEYVGKLKALPADKLNAAKDEAKRTAEYFGYMGKFKLLPEGFAPKAELTQFVKQQGWDKKK